MEKYILIDGEKFHFNEQELFHGRKTMDLKIAEENIKIFHSIIHNSGVRYGLMFGTLLGAIRENGFIKHDEDTDIYVLSEDKDAFFRLLPQFKQNGLEVVRDEGHYISLMRKNEYIDIYFFNLRRKFTFKKYRFLKDNFEVEAFHLEKSIERDFLGVEIMVPKDSEKVLVKLYGKDWRIPKKDSFAEPNSTKAAITRLFPWIKKIRINSKVKNYIKALISKL